MSFVYTNTNLTNDMRLQADPILILFVMKYPNSYGPYIVDPTAVANPPSFKPYISNKR